MLTPDARPFNALLLEGRFSESPHGDCPLCLRPQGTAGRWRSIEKELEPFVGQQVRFAAHHLPPSQPDPAKWGGGACHWQHLGHCPAGHERRPGYLYNVTGEGTLWADRKHPRHPRSPGGFEPAGLVHDWFLETFDGSRVPLELGQLEGHDGRIACVSLVDAETMRDIVAKAGADVVGIQARELGALLEQLKGRKG